MEPRLSHPDISRLNTTRPLLSYASLPSYVRSLGTDFLLSTSHRAQRSMNTRRGVTTRCPSPTSGRTSSWLPASRSRSRKVSAAEVGQGRKLNASLILRAFPQIADWMEIKTNTMIGASLTALLLVLPQFRQGADTLAHPLFLSLQS